MYAVVKRPCIHGEEAQYLEIIKAEESSECIVSITVKKWPEGNIETRGVNPTLLCAHNLPFDRRTPDKGPVDNFTALYMTNRRELFSIKYDGKKALLEILNFDKAKKLYQGLSQKLLPDNYVFDPAAYQAEAKNINQANTDLRASEKRKAEELEEYKKGSALYVQSGSSLGTG